MFFSSTQEKSPKKNPDGIFWISVEGQLSSAHCLGKHLGTLKNTPSIANFSSNGSLRRMAQHAKNCSNLGWFFSFSFVKTRLSYRDNLFLRKSRDLTETAYC